LSIQRITLVLIFILVLTACQPAPSPVYVGSWQYADLRLLGAANSTDPSIDLIAVYTRSRGLEEQIRLDLLDLADQPTYDLYLAIDAQPGGATWLPIKADTAFEWDTLVVIPASGLIQAYAPPSTSNPGGLDRLPTQLKMATRIVRDPLLDMLTISLNRDALGITPPGYSLQVFTTLAGSNDLIDSLGPVRSDGFPPPPARVLFAFWNSLPAYSPAQALRRWDGAHTGPLGDRHGLANLLRSARSSGMPLVLLDLKVPTSLSALDYVGGVNLVKDMMGSGLLSLPETLSQPTGLLPLPDWALQRALNESRQTGLDFGFPASPFLYATPGQAPPNDPARLIFAPYSTSEAAPQPVTARRWRDKLLVPIPRPETSSDLPQQATLDGPSLVVRRALVQTALAAKTGGSPESAPILVLGGDLPSTTWGSPRIARITFQYIQIHPWMQAMYAHDLLTLRPSQQAPALTPSPSGPSMILEDINAAPPNPLTAAAWQAYLALLSPLAPAPQGLENLRAAYLGQVEPILAAARWADQPASEATCGVDLDQDGQPECILSSENFFAVFEIHSGALTYLFALTENGPHQLIGPSSQFLTGASQPSEWDLSRGLAADPEVIPGAFAGPGGPYQVALESDSLTFTSLDGLSKSYQLTPSGVQLEYHSSIPVQAQLPLALDPWVRFSPGWSDRYHGQAIPQGWSWELSPATPVPGIQATPTLAGTRPLHVEIRSSAPLTTHSFLETQPYLAIPEDPNRDYPAGHFLPFPLAVVDFSSPGDFSVEIEVIP
jgi:hypothetical protein